MAAESEGRRRSPLRCLLCSEEMSLHVSLSEAFPECSTHSSYPSASKKSSLVSMSSQSSSVGEGGDGVGVVGAEKGGGSLSENLARSANLFDLLADAKNPLEHPLCSECADGLLDELDGRLRSMEEEAAQYRQVSARLAKEANTGPDLSTLKIELNKLQSSEKVVTAELRRLEAEEAEMERSFAEEKAETDRVLAEEERLYAELRDQQRKIREMDMETESLANQVRYAEAQLDRLSKTNVFNLAFHIWHDGHFGTINGLRLGRLPDVPVEWTEINAAWGQSVLLLDCLARKVGLDFQRYELVPFGNASYIRQLPDPSLSGRSAGATRELPLYYSGGHKFLGNNKLDAGMLGFLDCLGQLKTWLEKSAGFSLPHGLVKDRLVDRGHEYSLKIQFNSEERWTKAAKLMLINLKWALAWIASIHNPAT